MLNADVIPFKALVRRSHFTKSERDVLYYDSVYVFGVQSVPGHILTFHVMTDYGMMRSRVPLSELYWKEPDVDVPYHYKQLWDCFGVQVSVLRYRFLDGMRCEVLMKDKKKVWATYAFTVDWWDNGYSEEPSDYKCGHVLKADGGYFVCQPNNRLFWRDSNWITKKRTNWSDIKVDTELLSVEGASDRWVSDDTDCYYYSMSHDGV